jgi:Cdc6-like AAA superfamily ATPase
LAKAELVPDHALATGDPDLFGHSDLVRRLDAVLREASTSHSSANIALYGSWGSGKSSVSNLLADRLDAERRQSEREGTPIRHRFFSFDAFKYAREPFLRQFIRELSKQLPEDRQAHYGERLYQGRSEVRSRFRPRWGLWGFLLASISLLALGTDLLLAGNLHLVLSALAVALVSSAALIGLATLFIRFITVNTTTTTPDSDEQFEEIFCELLKEFEINATSDTKLVVFVDELDRCSPPEVAATLETLRTFLGVEGCFFIVAADQQVLEQALSKHVRQATPPDPANPYYSAGSAYLDKIFQYQLALPPFRARRLVNFALELVEGREGVWAEVDLAEVIPILLPTHVHSPRRVKVLLNAFALTYGLARARAERDELGSVIPRAPEIAKLVCLRVEFPLFARDLNLDDRLTEAVVTVATAFEKREDLPNDEGFKALPIEIRRRAISFARGDLPASRLLAEGSAQAGLDRTLLDYEDPAAAELKDKREENAAEDGREVPPAPVRHSQALQLVRYLEKSIDVPGPYSDLIHLEAAGATFDLDPQLAQQLERDALDRRRDEVVAAIAALDSPGRVNALRMLGQLAHESHGPDGRNVMKVLLHTVAATDVSLETLAPRLAPNLDAFNRRNAFDQEDIPGAFSIAIVAKRSTLATKLIATNAALEDPEFRVTILSLARHLDPSSHARLKEVAAAALAADGAHTARLIVDLPVRMRRSVLVAALEQTDAAIRRDLASRDPEGDPDGSERIAAEATERIEQIAAAAKALAGRDRRLAEIALDPLFHLPRDLAADLAIGCLAAMEPIQKRPTVQGLLDFSQQWSLTRTAELLGHVDPGARTAINASLDPLLAHIWRETDQGETETPAELLQVLARLVPAREKKKLPAGPASDALVAAIQIRVDSLTAAEHLDQVRGNAHRLAAVGLLPTSRLGGAIAETIASTVRPPIEAEQQPGMVLHLRKWLDYAIAHSAPTQLEHAHRALLADDCWIASPARETMALEIAGVLPKGRVSAPTATEMVNLSRENGRAAAPAVGVWIRRFARTPESVSSVVRPFASFLVPEIEAALQDYTRSRPRPMRARIAVPLIKDAVGLRLSTTVLRAMRIDAAEEEPLVAAICLLAADADNREERSLTLDIWEALEPRESGSWTTLIDDVLLRFANNGATSFDLARSRLHLCRAVPPESRSAVIDGMRSAVPKKKQKKDGKRARQLERALASAGLIDGGIRIAGRKVPFT